MDALQGRVDLIEGELRQIGDTLRGYLDSGQTPARKVKPPGTKAGRELLQHLLGRLEQVSTQVGGLPKWTSGLTPLPTGPDTPLSYGSPAAQQSEGSPSQLRDTPRDTLPSPSPAAALPRPQLQPNRVASPAEPDEPITTTPGLSGPPAVAPPRNGGSSTPLLQAAPPLLSDHASPLFTCTYRDINELHEELFEEFSRHPVVRDRGYFKLDVQDLPILNVEKMARPTKDHATSFCYKVDSRGLIKVDTGKRVKFSTPRLPFPRSAQAKWSFEEQKKLWNSTADNPPKGTQPYIIGNPLFDDVELSPGKKLLSRGKTVLEGINTQYVYFNLTGKTITTMHREDAHVRSENLLRSGANKFWCFVKPSSTAKMEEELRRLYPNMRFCSQSIRHLSLHIPPSKLDEWGVEYTLDYCVPGQAIVTEPGTYHQVLNAGPNYAVAINVEYLSSPDFPINYTFCDDNCPDKFAMSPEDFLIYPKPRPGAEPGNKELRDREETEDVEPRPSEEHPKASRLEILQVPVPLAKELPMETESIPSHQTTAREPQQAEPIQTESRAEPKEAQQPEQPPPKQAESYTQAPAPRASSSLGGQSPQVPIHQASLPATEETQGLARNRGHHILAAPEVRPVTNPVEQPQLPLQQPVALQTESLTGGPVFTAKKSQVLAHPVAESHFQEFQQFQPTEVLRPPESSLDWGLPYRSEPPIPPRPAAPKNPFSRPQLQQTAVPSLPPTPVYTSEKFLPYSNQNSPVPSPFDQEFFPTPKQNPGLYRLGGGHSPKTIPAPVFRPPRQASPPPDQVAQAAAALASMPNGSPAPAPPSAAPTVLPQASPAVPTQVTQIIPAAVSPVPVPVLPPAPKSKKRPAGAAPAKKATKKQRTEVVPAVVPATSPAPASSTATVTSPAIASAASPAVTPLATPTSVPLTSSTPVPIPISQVAQSIVPMALAVPAPDSPDRAAYKSLAMMVQGGGKTKAETLTAGLVDSPASRKAAFQRLDQLVRAWRMITISSIFSEGKFYDFINKVDEMAHFTTPIHIFLRRLIRMKMAGLVYNIGDTEEERRLGTIGGITSLLEKLGWTENDRGKLQHYIREGKCWRTICNNDDGMLCIMPLNTDLSDLAMFQEEVTRFHSQLSNGFTAALANIGRQLVSAIWEGRELSEFVWENYDTDALSPTEIQPLLRPYITISSGRSFYDAKGQSNAPRPTNWSDAYPWPTDPAVVRDGARHCDFCKRKKSCQCCKKRMPDIPRVEIDGPKGLGIRSRGEHKAGELLGELLGELVAPGSYPTEWTFELRRPDMEDELVAEIYPGRRGNWVRKVNHSEEPTAQFTAFKMSGRWRILLELLSDVKEGEEITAKFGRGYVKGSELTAGSLD